MKHGAVLVPALAAVSIFKLVLLLFPLGALAVTPLDGRWVVGLLALVAVVVAQPVVTVAVVRGREHGRGPAALAAAEFLLALPPLFLLGGYWSALPTLGLADVLLCTAGRLRLVIVAVGVVAYVAGCAVNFTGAALAQQLGEAGLSVTIFYAVLRMAGFIRELAQARVELARLAVGEERLRMARDLHDTLGHTLTVGLFKLEVARRMAAVDPERGRELDEVSQLLRESMGAVQDVVAGTRDTSLAAEIAGALSVLASAGIATTVDIADGPLLPEVEDALGWVVREGTTNVLRHSAATTCAIDLTRRGDGAVVLTMRNDAPAPPERRWAPSGGRGVDGMRRRLAAVGGELDVHSDGGGYRMAASVPGTVGP